MNEDATNDRPATCPRCGYDQRGVVTTWTECCPLVGTCTECGLQFNWPEVLSEKIRRPRWCVEYVTGRIRFLMATALTLGQSFWPWGFWQSLKMSYEPQWRRIAAYVLTLAILPYLLIVLMQIGVATYLWQSFGFGSAQKIAIQTPSGVVVSTMSRTSDVDFLQFVLWSAAAPYSDDSPGTVTEVWAANPWTGPGGRSNTASQLSPRSILQYWLVNSQSLVVGTGIWYKEPTWNIWIWSGQANLFWTGFLGLSPQETAVVLLTGFLTMTAFFSAAAFALLPQSRREAKVRWRHIIRVFLYSLALVLLLPTFFVLSRIAIFLFNSFGGWLEQFAIWSLVCIPLILVIWWSVATRRYLKMRHAWGVGAAVVVVAVLLTLSIAFWGSNIIKRF